MTIQWFPGHMAKAIREIKEKSKQIDIVLEVLDARIPLSSRNPVLDDIFKEKPRLLLFNKEDLADPIITKKWIDHFKLKKIEAISVNALEGKSLKKIDKTIHKIIAETSQYQQNKVRDIIHGAIFGIPNVGKSSFINHLLGKRKTKVGNKPGVTKAQSWLKISDTLLLLDTPGILWPKFETPDIGRKLAITNCIKETRYDFETIAIGLCDFLIAGYPDRLKTRFKIDFTNETALQVLEAIGKKRGCIIAGNEFDYDRIYHLFLKEYREGKLGRISLETPAHDNANI